MFVAAAVASVLFPAVSIASGPVRPYPLVDTGQVRTFDTGRQIAYPEKGAPFDGQDAQYRGPAASYRDNGDGTVSDFVTGLMWVRTPDFDRKLTFAEARTGASACRVGGYRDWRLPTVKELYSLIDFSGYAVRTEAASRPYIGTEYFDFAYGDSRRGERLIDAQYVSDTVYVGRDGRDKGGKVFGVNFADGRIKGYDLRVRGREKTFYVRCVRGGDVVRVTEGPVPDGAFAGEHRPMGAVEGDSGAPPPRGGFVARLDRDGDGKVSREEFDGPRHHFGVLDRDGDGYLDADEAPQGPPSPGRPARRGAF